MKNVAYLLILIALFMVSCGSYRKSQLKKQKMTE